MFQFPGFALLTLYIQVESTCFTRLVNTKRYSIDEYQVGSPIQRSMDQSLFSAPHGLSQSITSFIASYCQGIHQTPFSRLIWSRKRKTNLSFWSKVKDWPYHLWFSKKRWYEIVSISTPIITVKLRQRNTPVSVLLDLERL